jgi:hypothetical protein
LLLRDAPPKRTARAGCWEKDGGEERQARAPPAAALRLRADGDR